MMTRFVTSLSLLCLVGWPVLAQENAEEIIKNAIKAHGGEEKLSKLIAGEYKLEGTIDMATGEVAFNGMVQYQLPNNYRTNLSFDFGGMKLELVQVVKGKKAVTMLNDQPQRMSKAQEKEMIDAAFMQEVTQLVPLLDKDKYELKAGKPEKVGDQEAATVTVVSKGQDDIILFFDKKSNLLVKTARKGLSPEDKMVLEESIFTDYEAVNGVQVPMTVTVAHDGKDFMKTKIKEAKILEKIEDPKAFDIE